MEVFDPTSKPSYCSVVVELLGSSLTIEGWLSFFISEESPKIRLRIQPTVEYQPDALLFEFPMSAVTSITPAMPISAYSGNLGTVLNLEREAVESAVNEALSKILDLITP